MTPPSIVPHPEAAALSAEIAALRESLASHLADWHDLIDLERPWLLALYQEKLGAWELKRLELQAAVARAKRRLEKFQACLNEGKAPDLPAIDAALEREFVVWQQKVREAAEAHQRAQQWVQAAPLSDADLAELKQIYRKLVKALHPDVHPDQTEHQKDLWQRVQAAHAAHALADLKALELLAGETLPPPAEPHPDALETLRAERDKIAAKITGLARKRAEAEAQPPFTGSSPLRPASEWLNRCTSKACSVFWCLMCSH